MELVSDPKNPPIPGQRAEKNDFSNVYIVGILINQNGSG